MDSASQDPGTTDTPSPGRCTTDTTPPGRCTTDTPSPGRWTTDTPSPGRWTTDTPSPGRCTTDTAPTEPGSTDIVPDLRYRYRWETIEPGGTVVVIDVLRAFTASAVALAGGARRVVLTDDVGVALAWKRDHPGALAFGEVDSRAVAGFDFANSPAQLAAADLHGRDLVQRTTSGTRAVVAADGAARLWCASLVVASATARALREAGGPEPTYVISGRFPDDPATGFDDLAVARYIEALRRGMDVHPADVVAEVGATLEAERVRSMDPADGGPADLEAALAVDRYDFAMELRRDGDVRWIERS